MPALNSIRSSLRFRIPDVSITCRLLAPVAAMSAGKPWEASKAASPSSAGMPSIVRTRGTLSIPVTTMSNTGLTCFSSIRSIFLALLLAVSGLDVRLQVVEDELQGLIAVAAQLHPVVEDPVQEPVCGLLDLADHNHHFLQAHRRSGKVLIWLGIAFQSVPFDESGSDDRTGLWGPKPTRWRLLTRGGWKASVRGERMKRAYRR